MKKWRLHRKNIKRKWKHHLASCINQNHEAKMRIHHTLVEKDEVVLWTYNDHFTVSEPAIHQITEAQAIKQNIQRYVENDTASLQVVRESTNDRDNRRAYLKIGELGIKAICKQFR